MTVDYLESFGSAMTARSSDHVLMDRTGRAYYHTLDVSLTLCIRFVISE